MEIAAGAPERRCAVTRAVLPAGELIRFVAGPDGAIVPDLARKLPGRGVWVTCSRDRIDEAAAKGVFSRSLKAAVSAPADLGASVEALLRRRCLDYLSLANKAGEVVAGAYKLETALGKGQIRALLHAREAAENGRQPLDRRLRATAPDAPAPIGLFTSAELSLALGRSNVVHAGLKGGGMSRKLLSEVRRLGLYIGLEAAALAHFLDNGGTVSE
ncbi:MAG: RNA-binding protein [Hyphomicrobiaceae bacterium]